MGGTWTIRSVGALVAIAIMAGVGQFAQPAELPPARVVDAIIDTELLSTLDLRSAAEPVPTSLTTLPSPTPTALSSSRTTSTPAPGPTTTLAAPVTTAFTAAEPTERERGERALSSYTYDWRSGLPGWEISFHPGRQAVLGYTFVQEQRIEVYVRSDMSDALLAHVIAHELGHAIDVTLNSGDDRRRWQEQREITEAPWWPGNGATDFSTGAGDFAESFASWQVGNASFRSNVGDPPSADDNILMAELAAE